MASIRWVNLNSIVDPSDSGTDFECTFDELSELYEFTSVLHEEEDQWDYWCTFNADVGGEVQGTDQLTLFTRIEVNTTGLNYAEITEWTTEELDPGHFVLNVLADTINLSDRLKLYTEVDGEDVLVALLDLDGDIENGYYYSIRIEYPYLANKILDVRLGSAVNSNYEGDQIFVFDAPRHTRDEEVAEPRVNESSIETATVYSPTYYQSFTQVEDAEVCDPFEYYEFIS